jgi:hypothetical protein
LVRAASTPLAPFTLHVARARTDFFADERRLLRRVTILGEKTPA